MSDMRALGSAIEAYAADHSAYPAASCAVGIPDLRPERLGRRSFSQLMPTYIAQAPLRDGWGRYFGFARDDAATHYLIQSSGADDVFEQLHCGPTLDPRQDIAFSNGVFVQWPANAAPPDGVSRLAP